MSRIRALLSETAVYGLSSMLGRMLNFLLFPFYTHVLDPEAYGISVTIFASFVFLNVIFQYGMESAYLKSATTDRIDRAFPTALWSLLLSSLALLTILWLLLPLTRTILGLDTDQHTLLAIAAGILLVDTLVTIPMATLRLQHKPGRFAAIRLTGIAINIGLNIYLLVALETGVIGIFWANLGSSLWMLCANLPMVWRFGRRLPDRALWIRMVRFGLPFVPGGLGYALTERVNVFYLQRMSQADILPLYGPDVEASTLVGWFGGVSKLAVLLALGVQMFRYAWQPFFLQRAQDADAPALFGRVSLLVTMGMVTAWLGVTLLLDDLVSLPLPGGRYLIDPRYWVALYIVPPLMVGYLFQGWYYLATATNYIHDTTRKFVPATLLGGATAWLANTLLVPTYGMLGAAWSTTLAYAVMALALVAMNRNQSVFRVSRVQLVVPVILGALIYYVYHAWLGPLPVMAELGLLGGWGLLMVGLFRWWDRTDGSA